MMRRELWNAFDGYGAGDILRQGYVDIRTDVCSIEGVRIGGMNGHVIGLGEVE